MTNTYKFKYDSNGRLIEKDSYDSNGKFISAEVNKYNADGTIEVSIYNSSWNVIAKRTFDSNADLTSSSAYQYNSSNKLIEKSIFNSSGILIQDEKTSYNADGKLAGTEIDKFTSSGVLLQKLYYNKNWNLIANEKADINGNIVEKTQINFDINNVFTDSKIETYSATGVMLSKAIYNKTWTLVEYDSFSNDGKIARVDKYNYDNATGAFLGSQKNYYDNNSHVLVSNNFDAAGLIITKDKYSYDQNGLVIEKDTYDANGKFIAAEKDSYGVNSLVSAKTYFNKSWNIIEVDKFDINGNLSEKKQVNYDVNGALANSSVEKYNANGTISSKEFSNKNWVVTSKLNYDLNGNLLTRLDYTYAANNKLSELDIYDANGVLTQQEKHNFAANGTFVGAEIDKYSNGGVLSEKLSYNQNWNFIGRDKVDENGNVIEKTLVNFDSNNVRTGSSIEKYTSDGTVIEKSIYNKNWTLTEFDSYDQAGKLARLDKYNYDVNGAYLGAEIDYFTPNDVMASSIIKYGTNNDDSIVAYAPNTTLVGGAGNDTLCGVNGNTTFLFNDGDGKDKIYNINPDSNSVLFGNTVDKSNIALYKQGSDLVIDYGNVVNQDQITVSGQLEFYSYPMISDIKLNNNTLITSADINQIIQAINSYTEKHADVSISSVADVKNNAELMTVISNTWHS
ncbi:MAG: hypothetical protein WCK67_11710 [bacterium]